MSLSISPYGGLGTLAEDGAYWKSQSFYQQMHTNGGQAISKSWTDLFTLTLFEANLSQENHTPTKVHPVS